MFATKLIDVQTFFAVDYSPDTTQRGHDLARDVTPQMNEHHPPIVPHLPIHHPAVSSTTNSNIATTSVSKQCLFIALLLVSTIKWLLHYKNQPVSAGGIRYCKCGHIWIPTERLNDVESTCNLKSHKLNVKVVPNMWRFRYKIRYRVEHWNSVTLVVISQITVCNTL